MYVYIYIYIHSTHITCLCFCWLPQPCCMPQTDRSGHLQSPGVQGLHHDSQPPYIAGRKQCQIHSGFSLVSDLFEGNERKGNHAIGWDFHWVLPHFFPWSFLLKNFSRLITRWWNLNLKNWPTVPQWGRWGPGVVVDADHDCKTFLLDLYMGHIVRGYWGLSGNGGTPNSWFFLWKILLKFGWFGNTMGYPLGNRQWM